MRSVLRRIIRDGLWCYGFEPAVLTHKIGPDLLQRARLAAQILDLVGGGGTGRVAGQLIHL